MRPIVLLFVVLVAGCGPVERSSIHLGPTDNPAVLKTESQHGLVQGTVIRTDNGTSQFVLVLPYEVEAVWPELIGAYRTDAGISIETMEQSQRTLGNTAFTPRSRLMGERLSNLLRCGSTASGEIADQYRVRMSILSRLNETPDGETRLETSIGATARDPHSSQTVACVSTGRLEQALANAIAIRLLDS